VPSTNHWTDPPHKLVKEVGREDRKQLVFTSLLRLLFQLLNRKSMFAVLHSDINSLKSGLLHLTEQSYCKKGRSAKVKDGIIDLILRNYLVDRYNQWSYDYCKIFVNTPPPPPVSAERTFLHNGSGTLLIQWSKSLHFLIILQGPVL
jgi:hypothetical protein